jgi:hypothetical protein
MLRVMTKQGDGTWAGKIGTVDCYVRRFCPTDAASYRWDCVTGRGGFGCPRWRIEGSAQTETEALDMVIRFARKLSDVSLVHI